MPWSRHRPCRQAAASRHPAHVGRGLRRRRLRLHPLFLLYGVVPHQWLPGPTTSCRGAATRSASRSVRSAAPRRAATTCCSPTASPSSAAAASSSPPRCCATSSPPCIYIVGAGRPDHPVALVAEAGPEAGRAARHRDVAPTAVRSCRGRPIPPWPRPTPTRRSRRSPATTSFTEIAPDELGKSVKPKQFLHIDQSECIMCEGCVDICPWKCIHMLSTEPIAEARQHRAARRRPGRPRGLRRRRGRVHPVRPVRRPLPHRRDHHGQGGRRAREGDQHQRDNKHGYAYGMRF